MGRIQKRSLLKMMLSLKNLKNEKQTFFKKRSSNKKPTCGFLFTEAMEKIVRIKKKFQAHRGLGSIQI